MTALIEAMPVYQAARENQRGLLLESYRLKGVDTSENEDVGDRCLESHRSSAACAYCKVFTKFTVFSVDISR